MAASSAIASWMETFDWVGEVTPVVGNDKQLRWLRVLRSLRSTSGGDGDMFNISSTTRLCWRLLILDNFETPMAGMASL